MSIEVAVAIGSAIGGLISFFLGYSVGKEGQVMSMISAQCDELRERAKTLRQGKWSDGADDARLMEDAADTIEGLESENAKLRELLGGVGHLLFILDVDYCVACPRDSISHPCPVYTIKGGECLYKSDMRELGVEVDG